MFYYDDVEKKLKKKPIIFTVPESLTNEPNIVRLSSSQDFVQPNTNLNTISSNVQPSPIPHINEPDLSILDHLNLNLTDDFLIPRSKPKKTGLNFTFYNNTSNMDKYGLGHKKMKFVSSVFYNKVDQVYDFKNEEVVDFKHQKYQNIKFYMQTMLKDEMESVFRRMFNSFCNNLWLKSVKAATIYSTIIQYLSDQKEFWKKEYDFAYDNIQTIKKNFLIKENEKKNKLNKINDIIKEKIVTMENFISNFNDADIKEIFALKFNKIKHKINFTKSKFKVNFFNDKCSKLMTYINNFSNNIVLDDILINKKNLPNTIVLNPVNYETYLEKINQLKVKYGIGDDNRSKKQKWFGFFINNDLAKLLYLCSLPVDILNYEDNDQLTEKQKKCLICALIKLCKKTNSKQILYYINKWAKDSVKKKGVLEFDRTFGRWFDFKNKVNKYKDLFTDCCNILMTVLNVKHILIKNSNYIYKFPECFDNEHKVILYTPEEKQKHIDDTNQKLESIRLAKIENEKKQILEKLKKEEYDQLVKQNEKKEQDIIQKNKNKKSLSIVVHHTTKYLADSDSDFEL